MNLYLNLKIENCSSMENDIVNIKLKKYIYYLNKIGLLPEEDNFRIINIFYQLGKLYSNSHEILTSNFDFIQKYFKENIIKALALFLNSLTVEKNKKVSLTIYKNYIEKEKLFDIERVYLLSNLLNKLQIKKAFYKIYIYSKNSNNISSNISYNNIYDSYIASSYKFSNPKKIPNFSQINANKRISNGNSDNNNIRLSNKPRIIDSYSFINNQNDNNTISKISDHGLSHTFINEYSPFIKSKELIEKIAQNKVSDISNKKTLFSIKNNQLFNIKDNFENKNKEKAKLKLTPHFENLYKSNQNIALTEETKIENLKDKEMNNLIFKPKINIKNEKSINLKRIEKLYLDNQRKFDKRTEGIIIRDNKLSQENTFQPKFISKSVKKLKKNFSIRMHKFNKIKEEKKNKLMKSIETDYSTIYTFSPQLNINNTQKTINIYNTKKIPAYQRLYHQRRNQKRIVENTNSFNNKSVDYKKIEKLYDEYKILKEKRKKEQQILDKERGLTFNPLLINGNKYLDKIIPDFFEREKKFVEEQKNHINAYKNLFNKEKEKYLKKYCENKKIIIQNVVNRLYTKGIQKNFDKRKKPLLNNNNLYIQTEYKSNDNFDGKESIIVAKSNKSFSSIINKGENNLKNSSSNKEIPISIKSSGNFSLSKLINDKE